MAFTLLWISGFIMGACIVLSVLYSAYKITESKTADTLMEAEFPFSSGNITKKKVYEFEDFYSRPTSDVRIAMGRFYSDDKVESLRRKNSPQKLPKGRS